MKRVLREVAKAAVVVVAGIIGMWVVLSMKWSREEMSAVEQAACVVYGFAVVPACCAAMRWIDGK